MQVGEFLQSRFVAYTFFQRFSENAYRLDGTREHHARYVGRNSICS